MNQLTSIIDRFKFPANSFRENETHLCRIASGSLLLSPGVTWPGGDHADGLLCPGHCADMDDGSLLTVSVHCPPLTPGSPLLRIRSKVSLSTSPRLPPSCSNVTPRLCSAGPASGNPGTSCANYQDNIPKKTLNNAFF